jgi:hypothetical protein
MFTDVSKEPAASIFRTTLPPRTSLLNIDKHIHGVISQNTEILGEKSLVLRGGISIKVLRSQARKV